MADNLSNENRFSLLTFFDVVDTLFLAAMVSEGFRAWCVYARRLGMLVFVGWLPQCFVFTYDPGFFLYNRGLT